MIWTTLQKVSDEAFRFKLYEQSLKRVLDFNNKILAECFLEIEQEYVLLDRLESRTKVNDFIRACCQTVGEAEKLELLTKNGLNNKSLR